MGADKLLTSRRYDRTLDTQAEKRGVVSNRALVRENKAMRIGGYDLLRPCLIRQYGSHTRMSGRKLRWGCCLDYLFYFSYSSQQLEELPSIAGGESLLLATIRRVFRVYKDRAWNGSVEGYPVH